VGVSQIYFGKGYGTVLGPYKPSGFTRGEEFFEQQGDYLFLKRKSVPFYATFKSEYCGHQIILNC
jgi:hypothetical protein